MINDGKPSENEPEVVALLLETYEMCIINWLISPKTIPTKHIGTSNGFKIAVYLHY